MITGPRWHCNADEFQRLGPNVSVLEGRANRDVNGHAGRQTSDLLSILVPSPNFTITFKDIPKFAHAIMDRCSVYLAG